MTAHDLKINQSAKVIDLEKSQMGLNCLNRGVLIGKPLTKIRNVGDTYYMDVGGYPMVFTGGELKSIFVETTVD